MTQKTNPKKADIKKSAAGARTRKTVEVQPEEMIHLLKEMDDHLSSLSEAYNQYQEASARILQKLDHWEERFGQFESIVSRLKALESEVRDLTRGYLERIEALERRQANIETLERRLEREAA